MSWKIFSTVYLHEQEKRKFTFLVFALNHSHPLKRYHWKVVAQRMLNSSTLCQYFMQQPLEIIHRQFLWSIICHYMDDILLSDSDRDVLENTFKVTQRILPCWGLQIALEKIQRGDILSYLCYKISQQKFYHICYQSIGTSCKLLIIFKY